MSSTASAERIDKYYNDPSYSKTYSTIAGKVTGPPALALLIQGGLVSHAKSSVDCNFSGPIHVLDNACGTGLLNTLLYENLSSRDHRNAIKLTLGDISEQMIKAASEEAYKIGWTDLEAKIIDAQNMDVPDDTFDFVLTNFGGMADIKAGIKEWVRVAKPGGTIGFTTFRKVGWHPLLTKAVSRIPNANFVPSVKMGGVDTSKWGDEGFIRSALSVSGPLENIEITPVTYKTKLDEEFRNASVGALMNALVPTWTEEEQEICGEGRLEKVYREVLESQTELEWTATVVTAGKSVNGGAL